MCLKPKPSNRIILLHPYGYTACCDQGSQYSWRYREAFYGWAPSQFAVIKVHNTLNSYLSFT